MSKIIGIDLGTTNSCVAVMEGGKPSVIVNAEGMRTTPSVVAFTKSGERLIGEAAKRQSVTNADRTIASIKREMGTNSKKEIDGRSYSPQEISAMILQKLKQDAENYLGEKVEKAVITVPAYFNDAQRQATKDAGKIAGLEVERIINEPTAAALAYGLDNEKEQKIMVWDTGGGTHDVSIIEIGDGVVEVLATSGNNHLGGDDFDNRLAQYIINDFKQKEGIDISKDKMAMQRIKEAAEKAKKELSSSTSTDINLPFITADASGPKHLEITITRSKFNELIQDLIEQAVIPAQQALKDAGIQASELSKVLLVGGSTRIPAIQDKVRQLTGKEPSKELNPDECVALGAAIQGGKLAGEAGATDVLLLDVTPLSLSIETLGGVATRLIERNTTIPTRKSQVFSTAADNQSAVDIHVVQGERQFARDNKTLGQFRLDGIPPAPRGVPQIEVTFDIDANGIVSVSAKDIATGKEQKIVITSSSNMSDAEINKAVREAQEFEAQDKAKKEELDVRNDAESFAFQVKKSLQDASSLSETDKADCRAELNKLQELLKDSNASSDQIRQQKEKLSQVAQNTFSKMYQNTNTASDNYQEYQSQSTNPIDSDDNVIDGEYTEL